MTQVPNRYFNSPWIESAAKNLSLAIAGDPERDAARLQQKQIEADMTRKAEADARDADTRAKRDQALPLFSELLTLPPDDLAGRRRVAAQIVPLIGPDKSLFSAMGLANPETDVVMEKIVRQNEGRFAGIEKTQAEINARAEADRRERGRLGDQSNDTRLRGYDVQLQIAQLRDATTKALAAAKGKNGLPMDISPQDRDNIEDQVFALARDMGGRMEPALARRIVSRTTELYQTSRNSSTAFDQAVAEQNLQTLPGESRWFGLRSPAPGTATIVAGPSSAPTGSPAPTASPAMPSENLSGAFSASPPVMLRPFDNRATTPATGAPVPAPPAAVQMLMRNPTPQMKAAFQSKYGYLPPGM